MSESLLVVAPATSANLGPGFDTLALALDLANTTVVRRRPGPLEVHVEGEGADELPADAGNLFCRALGMGLADLSGLEIRCRNEIPLGRGLGSSAAAVCAGLVAANALGGCRWSPEEMLARATQLEGHADNAAACLLGGIVAVAPGPRAMPVGSPPGLALVTAVPGTRVSTGASRAALPDRVPLSDAAQTLARAVCLALALRDGRVEELEGLLEDRLHEPARAAMVPGLAALRELSGRDGCLGVTISGSGPTALMWCAVADAERVRAAAEAALAAAGVDSTLTTRRISATGVRARWGGSGELRLARAVG